MANMQGRFSVHFAEHGVNHWQLFAPDIMHEFDLGMSKSLFTHLLRILEAEGSNGLQKLDERYDAKQRPST